MIRNSLAAAALVALTATLAGAQDVTHVPVAPDSKLWIEGTSNLHAWSCKATTLDANIDFDAAAATQFATSAPKGLKAVDVKVPVKSIKCEHGGMDGRLYDALKADGSPQISYIMAKFDVVPGAEKDSFTLHTVGTLEIAGVTKPVDMDVTATRLADGSVVAKGVVPVKMTDFGVQPPTALFGRLKTGDEVKVNFELTVGRKAIADASSGKQ